jgi:hypothetical protein
MLFVRFLLSFFYLTGWTATGLLVWLVSSWWSDYGGVPGFLRLICIFEFYREHANLTFPFPLHPGLHP